jgi:myo-inositol-1(or 4)-monophosphatase
MDLRPYLETALEAAYIAKGIHQYYQILGFEQSTKSTPTDVVTQADKESEAAIRDLIARHHPGHVVLGEEEGQQGVGAFRWIVDPLDGTVNYSHGFPFYCTSIALEAHGEVVVGVVLDTARGDLFTATKGGGSFMNGRPMRVSGRNTLIKSLLATGFPYDVGKDKEPLAYLERILMKGITVRRPGAAALDLAYVAAGMLEGFWETRLNAWDVAAGWLLVTEAGGRVTGFQNEPYALGNRYLLTSNGHIHQEFLDTLMGRV